MQPLHDLVAPLADRGYIPAARLRTRSALEISGSPWSIGLETMDRGYVDFDAITSHLGELGAKYARVQAGWARCEPIAGQLYDWSWLDTIVEGCIRQGITPWLQTSYGNPAYSGGGGSGLSQALPSSPEALVAWDQWIDAAVARYGDRVTTWEIWNEPDNHGVIPPETYASFFIRTATRLRATQPHASIVGLALSGHGADNYAGRFLSALSAAGHADLLDELCFHFYPHNPDDQFDTVADLARLLARHAPHVILRQGETGAPSECVRFMALGEHLWNERKQAAWNLRRLLAHHARGLKMNLFQIADMYYEPHDGALFSGYNPKGQLRIRPDKTVAYRKPSYFAVQHVFTVFDNAFPLQALVPIHGRFDTRVSAYAWQRTTSAAPDLFAWWRSDAPPSLSAPDLKAPFPSVGLSPAALADPVLVDFLSGIVFTVPASLSAGNQAAWADLPCAETPLALAERATLSLRSL